MTIYYFYSLTTTRTITFGYINGPQTFHLLDFPCCCVRLVYQVRDRRKNSTKKVEWVHRRQFSSEILPMVLYAFCKKWEDGVWNQGILRIIICVLLVSYIDILLEVTISSVLSYPDVGKFIEWNSLYIRNVWGELLKNQRSDSTITF